MKQFSKAARNRCKIKMALQGASGSGKTYSALLMAYGLTGDWNKVAVLDSENGSAQLYSELGDYSVMGLSLLFKYFYHHNHFIASNFSNLPPPYLIPTAECKSD